MDAERTQVMLMAEYLTQISQAPTEASRPIPDAKPTSQFHSS